MTKMTTPHNIFVLGDLVLDHFIPVTEKLLPHQPVLRERVVDGHQRRTIAGGAANCARVIAALGRGRACLWGLSGYSPWGAFVQILDRSIAADGAETRVIFHGAHNEAHQMNTITRVVSIGDDGVRHRELRIDDLHFVPVTDSQRRDAVEYLRAETEEHGLSAIIINDLDMKALSEPLIKDIGDFAAANDIPLFVDPKRDWRKYLGIKVTCALPNLTEWCHIINDSDGDSKWREALASEQSLKRMAARCQRYMPNASFHIIKCDRDGAVVVGPANPGQHFVYHISAHPIPSPRLPGQLGAGDVLVAALALEFASLRNETNQTSRMLKSLSTAGGVVGCYLGMDWQKVPNQREMQAFEIRDMQIVKRSEVADGLLLLPPADQGDIDLQKYSVEGSALVSVDDTYHNTIRAMLHYLSTDWHGETPGSAILTGRGGNGKSELIGIIQRRLEKMAIPTWTDARTSLQACLDVLGAKACIIKKLAGAHDTKVGLLVVIDEAFTAVPHLLLADKGKMLLQLSVELGLPVRYLFIDADYSRHRAELSQSQFIDRCKEFESPTLASRHCDIPYIFAMACLRHSKKIHQEIRDVKISEAVLLSAINWVLNTPEELQSARRLYDKAKDPVTNALAGFSPGDDTLTITRRHLDRELNSALGGAKDPKTMFRFSGRGIADY
jgi:bifunctional ADP-heptose synthase (sugar kinase/adenylyltransferase)